MPGKEKPQPKLGDYVTARLVKGEEQQVAQGVLFGVNKDGSLVIRGEGETFRGRGLDSTTVVPDKNVFRPETLEHIQTVREELRAQQESQQQ